MFSVAVIAL